MPALKMPAPQPSPRAQRGQPDTEVISTPATPPADAASSTRAAILTVREAFSES
jgi:hypothetical protein